MSPYVTLAFSLLKHFAHPEQHRNREQSQYGSLTKFKRENSRRPKMGRERISQGLERGELCVWALRSTGVSAETNLQSPRPSKEEC